MESGLQIRNISRQGAIPNNNKNKQKQTKNQTRTEQLTTNVYDVFSALTSIFSRFKKCKLPGGGWYGIPSSVVQYRDLLCYMRAIFIHNQYLEDYIRVNP